MIKRIAQFNNINYDRLKREIETGKKYEETITLNDRINELNSTKVEALQESNMSSVLEYGQELVPHSKYIHSHMPEIIEKDDNETSISTINHIISNMIYTKEEPVEKQQGLLARIFNNEPEKAPVKVMVDTSRLSELQTYINNITEKLKQELLRLDEFRKYIEEYSKVNRKYLETTNESLKKITESLEKLDPSSDEDYSKYLTMSSITQMVTDKANRFSTVNLLMRKELLRVNQAIVKHFTTINSLEMARDDLIPLIESELTIIESENSEKNALELSQNIMGLFQSLLTRDVDGTIKNMKELQKRIIPEELATTINDDITTYMQGVKQIKLLEEKIENMGDIKTEKQKTLEKTYSPKSTT